MSKAERLFRWFAVVAIVEATIAIGLFVALVIR